MTKLHWAAKIYMWLLGQPMEPHVLNKTFGTDKTSYLNVLETTKANGQYHTPGWWEVTKDLEAAGYLAQHSVNSSGYITWHLTDKGRQALTKPS